MKINQLRHITPDGLRTAAQFFRDAVPQAEYTKAEFDLYATQLEARARVIEAEDRLAEALTQSVDPDDMEELRKLMAAQQGDERELLESLGAVPERSSLPRPEDFDDIFICADPGGNALIVVEGALSNGPGKVTAKPGGLVEIHALGESEQEKN